MDIEEIIKTYKTGDTFTCRIRNISVEGKILIQERLGNIRERVYLCHNNGSSITHGGRGSTDLGYKYSWSLDSSVSELVITQQRKPEEIINNYSFLIMTREEILAKAIREYPIGTEIISCQSGSIYIITSQKANWLGNDLQFVSNTSTPYVYFEGSWSAILKKAPSVEPQIINNYSLF